MYQVIARKYRPQAFDHLIGQEHIKQTLSNALEQQRIAHGYIFSGQRGTGKTTVARIMARCLNCVEGPTMNPCGKCASCLEVSAGNSVDVIEIDAASNRGINEMRELRESVRFRPARDRFKVFIIDEAHQITSDAFNALLKTLEEPPSWVVFMLCTTESHKLPATISSRCQHFSFRSVELDELVVHMQRICQQEGIHAESDALTVIAQAGGGSVRDSLSALDQAIACCGDSLNAEQVRFLMGAFSLDTLLRVTDALEGQNAQAMLQVVDELERSGQNLQHFCRELAAYFRNLLVARVAGENRRLIAATKPELERLVSVAQRFSERDLTRYLNIALDLFAQLQHSLQPRFHVELGLLRLIEAGRIVTIEQAISALRRMPKEEAAGGGSGSVQGSQAPRQDATSGADSGVTPRTSGFSATPHAPSGAPSASAPSASAPSTSAPSMTTPRFPGAEARGRLRDGGAARNLAVQPQAAEPKAETEVLPGTEAAPGPSAAVADASVAERPAAPRLSVLDGGRAKTNTRAAKAPEFPCMRQEAPPPEPVVPESSLSQARQPGNKSPEPRGEEPKTPMESGEPVSPPQEYLALQQQLVDRLNEEGKRFTADAVERAALSVQVLSGGASELRIVAPRETKLSLNENELRQALRGLIEPLPRIRLEFREIVQSTASRPRARSADSGPDDEALRQQIEADPAVQHVLSLFRGKITKVRNLRNRQ